MKKPSREISIFGMSTLDLFASALGAFMLITVVLLPYFPNLNISGREKAQLEKVKIELEQAKIELELAEAALEQASVESEREMDRLQRKTARLEQDKAKLERARAKSPKTRSQLEERVADLQQELDDTTVLLGIRTKAKRFVFVIDMSSSIFQPGQHDYRQFIALSMQDILDSFKADIEICLIGFQGADLLHYWPPEGGYFTVKKQTRGRVVSLVRNWMKSIGGGSPTRAALLAAMALHPEEIILLSDGAPTEDWQTVVQAVTDENKRKIPIHAVAVGNYTADRDFIDFLVRLTQKNNGYVVGAKPG